MSEIDLPAPAVPPEASIEVPDPPAPAPPPLPLAPVAANERVELIDIIRGMALFGILAANIRAFAGPAAAYFMPSLFWPAMHDRLAQAFVDAFIQGKFITIFATLFGVGFGVQVERALRRGGRFNWTWARRCFVLVLFGLLHGLAIWFGDILLVYALVGFLILPFKLRKDKTVAIWAVVLYLIPTVIATLMFIGSLSGAKMPDIPLPTAAELRKTDALFSTGSYMAIEKERAHDAVAHNWGFFPFYFWQILGLFLAGMLLWRKGFFRPSPESLPRYRRAMAYGLAVGVIGNVATVALRWAFELPPMPTTFLAYVGALIPTIAVPALSLGYVCAVVLLFHDPGWRARIQRFGAVGRTAFSNYLLQSIVGTLIFYGYGLGFFGEVGPAVLLPVTVAIFAVQVVLSRWWLARYRFGPMEWVWRKLTYGGPLPMRRESAAAVVGVADASAS